MFFKTPTKFSCLVTIFFLGAGISPASAQSIAALVNGVPITSVDIATRIKLLRAERQPASAATALESLASDIIKLQEMKTYSVTVGQGDINQSIIDTAKRIGVNVEVFANSMQRAGLTPAQLADHWRAEAGYTYIVRAKNKMVEPSSAQIDAAIAAKGGTGKQSIDYKLQQIVFAVPNGAAAAEINRIGHEAVELRTKFNSCDSGLALARTMPNAVLHDPVTRNSSSMAAPLLKILDATPLGHLTSPARDVSGISVVAVCGKSVAKNQESLRTEISNEIMAKRLDVEIAESYAKLRKTAIVQKR